MPKSMSSLSELLDGFEDLLEQEPTSYVAELDRRAADTREALKDLGVEVSDPNVGMALVCVVMKLDSDARRLQREGAPPVESYGRAAIRLACETTHLVGQRVRLMDEWEEG